MQPFGLFSLLQTLAGGTPPVKTEPIDDAEKPPTPPAEQETDDKTNDSNRQAILHFLSAHEQRAKKTKK